MRPLLRALPLALALAAPLHAAPPAPLAAAERQQLEASAAAGDPAAQLKLGEALRDGDPAQAAQWIAKAAWRGLGSAQMALGTMYLRGEGVKADPLEAYRWYHLAARSTSAGDAYKAEVAKLLTPEQVAQAERLAADFKPGEPPPPAAPLSSPAPAAAPPAPTPPAPAAKAQEPAPMAAEGAAAEATPAPKAEPPAKVDAPAKTEPPAKRAEAPAKPKPVKAPLAKPPIKPAVELPDYYVQVGSYANPASAAPMAERLKGLGYRIVDQQSPADGQPTRRLRVGPFRGFSAAREVAAKLDAQLGIHSWIVEEGR